MKCDIGLFARWACISDERTYRMCWCYGQKRAVKPRLIVHNTTVYIQSCSTKHFPLADSHDLHANACATSRIKSSILGYECVRVCVLLA